MLVSDPDALDLTGGVFWIDRDDNQTPILCGVDDLVNPRGIAIVPAQMDAPNKAVEPKTCRSEEPTPVAPGVGEQKPSSSSTPHTINSSGAACVPLHPLWKSLVAK